MGQSLLISRTVSTFAMMKFVIPLLLLATFLYEANGTALLEKKAWNCGDANEPGLTGSGVGDYTIAVTSFPPGCEYTLGGVDDVPYGASVSYDKKYKDVDKQEKFRLKAVMGGEVAKFKYNKKATVLPAAYFTIENWSDLKKVSKDKQKSHTFNLKVTLVQTANCHVKYDYNDADVADTAISIPAISGKEKHQYCLYYWKPKSGNGAKKVTVTVAGAEKAKNCIDGYMAYVSNYDSNQAFLSPTMKCGSELSSVSVVGAAADKHIAVLIYRKKKRLTDLSIKYAVA